MALIDFLLRWGHVLFGITWIGLLYYFNFVQGSYFKEADASAKADATQKLVPRALWWFRWGAMFTFLTGVYLLYALHRQPMSQEIVLGAIMGTFMFLNVWLIIWPAQKIVIGLSEGDAAKAGPKALLASRTNTLFSAPMLYGMLASKHSPLSFQAFEISDTGYLAALGVVLLVEANGIFGKTGPMTSVAGVIHSSLALTVLVFGLVHFL